MTDLLWGCGLVAIFGGIVIYDKLTGSKDNFTAPKYNLRYDDYEHRYNSGFNERYVNGVRYVWDNQQNNRLSGWIRY
jgi:hypothetical protein